MHTKVIQEDVAEAAPIVEMRGITIRFPGVLALDDVDFTLRPGEVHALMGENGAGKSSLIKALTGVYSVDHGGFVVVPIKLVHRTPVAPTHRVVEVKLAHGVILNVTPDHPTADGRTFADLAPGDRLDGVRVEAVRVVPYGQAFTHDILPDSDSGSYVAGGVLIGSALAVPVIGHAARASADGRRASLPPPLRSNPFRE